MPAYRSLGGTHSTIRKALVSILWLAVGADMTVAAAAPRVLRSNSEELLFSLDVPAIAWRQAPVATGDGPAWDAVLPGFVASGTPSQVRVPRAGGWLLVPPGTTPRLEVVREEWQPLDGRRLSTVPVPVIEHDPETGRPFERRLLPQPGQPLPTDKIPEAVLAEMQRPDPALQPGPAVRLGEVTWWRGRRIVSYTILPIKVSEQTYAQEVLQRGEWRVRFVADPAAGRSGPPAAKRRLGSGGDGRFGAYFLNGDILAGLPTEAIHQGSGPAKVARPAAVGTSLGYPEVRIPVNRTRLYRVRASELQAGGLLPQTPVQLNQIRLYQRRYLAQLDDPADDETAPYLEIEVPIHMVASGETFSGEALFLFWGLRPSDDGAFDYVREGVYYSVPAVSDSLEINNANNIYWLQLADPAPSSSWARMEQGTLPPAQGAPEQYYQRTDVYAEAIAYRENVPFITTDRYYYNRSSDYSVQVTLRPSSPVAGQVDARLQAGIASNSNDERDLQLDLMVGETPIAVLPGYTANNASVRVYDAELPAAALDFESFSLRIRRTNTVLPLASFLDWVKISYNARYIAPAGRLQFPGGDGVAYSSLEIPGFDTNDVGLVEVTNPRAPLFIALSAGNVVPVGGAYVLSLYVDQSGGPREFYAATRMTTNGVAEILYNEASLAPDGTVPTRLTAANADVLVVVHPQFQTSTQAWIEYRRHRSGTDALTIHAVDPQHLYDWYSGGLKDPWAIKRFVNHALDSPTWGSWALVLVGTANENPRQLGVPSAGRPWSRDWVPTHFHVQTASSNLPEVLGSDKWYACQIAGDAGFPGTISQPTDLYVGRFPVNTPAEVERLLAKIQQVESAPTSDPWRRRGIFIADDAWSSGSLSAEGIILSYQAWELLFETSEDGVMAPAWVDNGGMVDLTAETVLLRPFMHGAHPNIDDTIRLSDARVWCANSGAPEALIAALSRGGTLAHFQGHANHWVLTHEHWFRDDARIAGARRDVNLLTNVGKPFLFCGMGCHLGDFAQNVAATNGFNEPGLGEKLLLWTDGGAVAVYASTGFEYGDPNRDLSEIFLDRMVNRPPHMTIGGETVTSRWLLGELKWASEADILAISQGSFYRGMVYQFAILGDPLLMFNGGLPEVEAELTGPNGGPLVNLQGALVAVDASGQRTLTLQARDEAGIDRLRIVDSAGADLPGALVVETPYYATGSRQIINYELTLPVRPFAHDVLLRIYDSAAPLDSDAHVVVTLNVAQEIAVVNLNDGEPLDPTQFAFVADVPVPLELTVTSAAWFDEATTVTAAGEAVELSGFSSTVVNDHTLRVLVTATVPADKSKADRGMSLVIDGYPSYVALETNPIPLATAGINGLVSFPNPSPGETRFLFSSTLTAGRGRVRVWTVSGRQVADVPFTLDRSRIPASDDGYAVAWNGRDRVGDRLANGTYLYRVELETGAGQVRSGMQRLVIMR